MSEFKDAFGATPIPPEETSFSSDGSRSVHSIRTRPVTLDDARQWIASTGDDPDDFDISIRHIAYGVDMVSNRMSATPKKGRKIRDASVDIDPHEVLRNLRTERPKATRTIPKPGDKTLCISLNDFQYGKRTEQGSTVDTIAVIDRALKGVIRRQSETGADELVVIFGGDLVEGCFIYPNMAFNLEMSRRQQIEGVVALGLEVLDELAPRFKRVQVLAVRGNHGEHRAGGNKTTLEDNDDTLCVQMMQNALSRDKSMQHIEWTIAIEQAAASIQVRGWKLGTTHGDIYGKFVPGGSVNQKAHNWYKNMAAGRDEAMRDVDVFIGHHWHHRKMEDWGAVEWHQTPAQDAAMSEYFRQSSGMYSEPGVLSWLMSETNRYYGEEVL